MDDLLYREILLDYWQNPKNYGVIKNPDIDITKFNSLCGDKVRIMAKLKNGKIEKVNFTCKGCIVAKALTCHLTLMASKMKVEDFLKIEAEEFLKTVNFTFSPARIKCALLGFSAFREALIKNQKKSKNSKL